MNMLVSCRRAATTTRALVVPHTASLATSAQAVVAETLQLQPRPKDGSRAARRLRQQGQLPGILYGEGVNGKKDRELVSLETRTFERIHRKLWSSIENQVFEVQVGEDGPREKVLMRDAQFDPVTDIPVAVNFLRYKPGHQVTIPIKYLNEEGSPGLKRGGYINHIFHELPCHVFSDQIPATLQVDVNGLHVGDKIYLDAIKFPEGIVPMVADGQMVSKIAGRRGLIPRSEPVEEVEEVVEEEKPTQKKAFDIWNDVF